MSSRPARRPLKPIGNESEYDVALAEVDALMAQRLTLRRATGSKSWPC